MRSFISVRFWRSSKTRLRIVYEFLVWNSVRIDLKMDLWWKWQKFQNSFYRFWMIFIFKLSISKHKNWGLLPLVGYKNGSNIVRSSWNFNTKKYRYSWVHPQNFSFLTRWFLVKMGFIIRLVWKIDEGMKTDHKAHFPIFDHSENLRV